MDKNNEFIDDVFKNVPGNGMPSGITKNNQPNIQEPDISKISGGLVQNEEQLTPEYFDSIITNKNEHPEIRKKALETKNKLFPHMKKKAKKEEPILNKEVKPQQTIEVNDINFQNKNILSQVKSRKEVSPEEFSNLMTGIQSNIYSNEINLLCENTSVKIKSMTVEEYKFLTKQMEMFELNVDYIKKSDLSVEEKNRRIQLCEFDLMGVLDTILQRCVQYEKGIDNLSVFDWVYCLLNVRLVSKGNEALFIVKGKDDSTVERVEFSIDEMVDYLYNNRSRFVKNPIGLVDLKSEIHAAVCPPIRSDVLFAQNEFKNNVDSNFYITQQAMSVKGFVKEDTFYYLTPEQRIEFMKNLPYKGLVGVNKLYKEYNDNFFNIINEFVEIKNPNSGGLDISDFILFFFDF